MAYLFNFPNVTNGPDQYLIDLSSEIIAFPIMILMWVYLTVFLGGMSLQRVASGYIDAPMWSTVGFLATDLVALIMSLSTGIISIVILGPLFAGTIFSGLWLFLSRGRFDN